jgi:hypothetical protein
MSQHSPEPWAARDYGIYSADGKCVFDEGDWKLTDEDRARVLACVNACRGIPTHVLENRQGTDTEGLRPEDWLLNTVTEDGSGYVLASPAGGVMRLTSEQRERIGKALGGLSWDVPLSDYCKCVTHTGGLADIIPSLNNVQQRPTEPAEKV